MSKDERPRPEYGEYASETEQALAIERSGAPHPAAPVPATPAERTHTAPPSATKSAQPAARTTKNTLDRIATIFLLSFGFVYVIGGAESYFTLGASMERMFGQFGIGDYTATPATPVIGIVIVVSQTVTWLIAAGWSYLRIRRGRGAWWIPVAAGLVSFLISIALLGVLLGSDPAFLSYVSSASR